MKIPAVQLDPKKNLKGWYVFPDMLPSGKFYGFRDRDDETLLRGAWVVGQNVKFSGNSLPAIRSGYELVGGTEPTDTTPVTRAWTFETRGGDVYELKAYGTGIYWRLEGVSTEWSLLKGGFTSGLEFGYANIGETAGLFHTWFSNGTDAWMRWNGARATVSAVTANTISIASGTWTGLGFYTAGTRSVIIDGTEYEYTGGEGTDTLTGVTPDPDAGGVTAGDMAVQSPQTVSFTAGPDASDVIMAHDGRIHSRGGKKSVWRYSKLDDPDDWTVGGNDADGGEKDIESSGPLVAFGKLNGLILAFKRRQITSLEFVQSGTRVDVPRYRTFTSSDDKSTTIGATNQRSTFSTPFGVVFVTQDKRLILLTGMTQNNEPEYVVLSDPIQPVFDRGVHTDACGIFVDGVLWYAFKETSESTFNDVVVRGDMTRQTPDKDGRILPIQWDAPYVGWNVADWTSVYDADLGRNAVHWHSSTNSATYRVVASNTDNTGPFTATVRSWAETFDAPARQKIIDMAFVQVRMRESTELTHTLLLDKDGVTQQKETLLSGEDTDKMLGAAVYNPFGASEFGSQKFGSNEEVDDTFLYHFDIEVDPNVGFFHISSQFSSSKEGQTWEVVRFGYRLKEVQDTNDYRFLKG